MSFQFQRAARRKAKARVALTGPSGSGKTLGALYMAAGIGGSIAVIDTESQSASLYADKPGVPAYDVCVLEPPFHPRRYIEALHAAEAAGYDIIIIDSLSHAWIGTGGALDIKDTIASGRGQNSFTAWGEVGRYQNELMDALLRSPKHVIATMRSKQEYAQEKDEKSGKTVIRKLGMAPQQRDGVEYEFGIVLDVSIDHTASSSKDRSGLFGGQWFKITPDCGKALADWLNSGAAEEPPPAPMQSAAPPAFPTDPDREKALMALKAAARQKGYPRVSDAIAANGGKVESPEVLAGLPLVELVKLRDLIRGGKEAKAQIAAPDRTDAEVAAEDEKARQQSAA